MPLPQLLSTPGTHLQVPPCYKRPVFSMTSLKKRKPQVRYLPWDEFVSSLGCCRSAGGGEREEDQFRLGRNPHPALPNRSCSPKSRRELAHPEQAAQCFGWDFGVAKNLSILSTHLQDSRQDCIGLFEFSSFLQGLLRSYVEALPCNY